MGNLSKSILKGAKAYQGQKIADRNSMVVQYAPLVKRVALHLKTRLPSYVDVNDLIQSGMIGLIDAIQNFKDGQGATFETYASIRIRGSIIDQLRQSDWTPRSVHQNTRAIRDSLSRLAHVYGRPPTDAEVAADLNVDINKYHQMLLESNTSQVMGIEDTGLTDDVIGERSLSDVGSAEHYDKLFDAINAREFKAALIEAIKNLPERERAIVGFYYDQEMNLREIGLIMGISESRTCQVLSQALNRLRANLDEWSAVPKRERQEANYGYREAASAIKEQTQHNLSKRKSLLFADDGTISAPSAIVAQVALDSDKVAPIKAPSAKSATYSRVRRSASRTSTSAKDNDMLADKAVVKTPARRGRPSAAAKAARAAAEAVTASEGLVSSRSRAEGSEGKIKSEGGRPRGRPSSKPLVLTQQEFEALQKKGSLKISSTGS